MKGISAKAIQVVVATGDGGPVCMIGINLPNAADIREHYGSKSVSLSNVLETRDKAARRNRSGSSAGPKRNFSVR